MEWLCRKWWAQKVPEFSVECDWQWRGWIADVVRLQMKRVTDMLEPQGIRLECTPQAIAFLAEEGYDPDFGARPVKRAIQQFVLNDLSKKLLADEIDRDKPIIIDDFGNGLVFRN